MVCDLGLVHAGTANALAGNMALAKAPTASERKNHSHEGRFMTTMKAFIERHAVPSPAMQRATGAGLHAA